MQEVDAVTCGTCRRDFADMRAFRQHIKSPGKCANRRKEAGDEENTVVHEPSERQQKEAETPTGAECPL